MSVIYFLTQIVYIQLNIFILLDHVLTHRSGVCRRGRKVPREPSTSPANDPVNTPGDKALWSRGQNE